MTDPLDPDGVLPRAAPGAWRAHYRPDAPGAVLDGLPWAKSWATFLSAVNGRGEAAGAAKQAIKNAMSERIPAEGGFLVPEFLRSQVMAYMTPAIVRPRAMVMPMSSMRMPVPTLDNPSQASGAQALGGLTFSFTEDGAQIASSNPAFGRVVLEAHKLAALMTVPNELADDASGAFGDFLARVIAMGYAWVEDDYFIGTSGTGVGCPQSLLNAPAAVTVTRAGSPIALADITGMVNKLHPASLSGGLMAGVTDVAWLLSASTFNALLQLYVAVGTPVNTAAGASPWLSLGDGYNTGPSMLGLPVFVTDHQPAAGTKGDAILADLRHYAIGDRLAMTVERSSAGSGFVTDASSFRVRSRVDGRYWIQSASTTEASQSASPVVVLV